MPSFRDGAALSGDGDVGGHCVGKQVFYQRMHTCKNPPFLGVSDATNFAPDGGKSGFGSLPRVLLLHIKLIFIRAAQLMTSYFL